MCVFVFVYIHIVYVIMYMYMQCVYVSLYMYICISLSPCVRVCVLVLKRTRRTDANRAQGEGAQIMDARHTSTQNFLKIFHIPQSIFCINNLYKCIKK